MSYFLICSVQFSRSVVSDSVTPWIAARQASLSITNSRSSLRLTSIRSDSITPWTAALQASLSSLSSGVCSNSCSLSQWYHPTILSSVAPFCLQSFPASGSFPLSQLFASGGKGLELQHQFFQWIFSVDFLLDGLVWSPCSPRDSQESSTPQFKGINSLVLSPLYGPALASAPYCSPISPLATTSLFSVSLSWLLFLFLKM